MSCRCLPPSAFLFTPLPPFAPSLSRLPLPSCILCASSFSHMRNIPTTLLAYSKEVDEMVNNGFLYHTIDDDHFLPP